MNPKTLLIVFIVNFASDSYGEKTKKFFRNDYTYMEELQSFYKIHTVPQTWADAKRVCALEQATFWHPDNDDEANALLSFWNKTKPSIERLYVALSDLSVEGSFETIDGKSAYDVYNRWNPGEPNNDGNVQHCASLYLATGTLDDDICYRKNPIICKKTLQSVTCNNQCDIPNLDGEKSKKFFRNDYTYMEELQSFYKIHTVPQTWADAKRVCALEQATFWHPDNDDEANALLSFWNKTKPSIERLYVALSDLSVEGSFETIDGKSAYDVYNRWNPGEPNNDGNVQHCATLYLATGTLDDDICYRKNPIICKKTLQSVTWNNQCDIPNLDYTINNNNGKCYKLHTTPLNWNEAKAVCQLEQSCLANVNNQLDANYLAKLTESTSKPRVKGFYQRGIYHLGFYYKFDEGWRTVGGTPLNAERDAWFDNHQPDFNEHEECGSMFYTGRLINTNCDMKSFFICEHAKDNFLEPDIRISD